MEVIRAKSDLALALKNRRFLRMEVGFVPTMGALHEGHASLIRRAKKEVSFVVLSIFVNPTQFTDSGDFNSYPSTLASDLELAREEGVDLVFVPQAEDVYDGGAHAKRMDYGRLTSAFEGRKRPGHFDGVIEVVRRLFNIVQPSSSFFGEKDLQQLQVIRHLGKAEFPSMKIVGCGLIRDADGLAMSSRNIRIREGFRDHALKINSCLLEAKNAIAAGLRVEEALALQRLILEDEPHVELEYFAAVDPDTFEEYFGQETEGRPFLIVAAVVSGVRLIDNCLL